MFQNYSQTYASLILALSGATVMTAKFLGYDFAQDDIVFALGVVANLVGNVWGLIHRYKKRDLHISGIRLGRGTPNKAVGKTLRNIVKKIFG